VLNKFKVLLSLEQRSQLGCDRKVKHSLSMQGKEMIWECTVNKWHQNNKHIKLTSWGFPFASNLAAPHNGQRFRLSCGLNTKLPHEVADFLQPWSSRYVAPANFCTFLSTLLKSVFVGASKSWYFENSSIISNNVASVHFVFDCSRRSPKNNSSASSASNMSASLLSCKANQTSNYIWTSLWRGWLLLLSLALTWPRCSLHKRTRLNLCRFFFLLSPTGFF